MSVSRWALKLTLKSGIPILPPFPTRQSVGVYRRLIMATALKAAPRAKKSGAGKGKNTGKIKRVYFFGNGKAEGNAGLKDLLGGKGANLADMTLVPLPVPPGFTITTETCGEYNDAGQKLPKGLMDDVRANIA